MPEMRFPFEQGTPNRVAVSWGLFWRNIRVVADDREVGRFGSRQEFEKGRSFTLHDGSELHVAMRTSGMNPAVTVTRNGQVLPDSGYHHVKTSYEIMYFVGGISIAAGLAASVFDVAWLLELGVSWGTALVGALYIGLGFLVAKFRSRVALGVGMVLFALDVIAGLAMTQTDGHSPAIGGLVFKGVLLMSMWRGMKVLGQKAPT
jgi:hypothetical protein